MIIVVIILITGCEGVLGGGQSIINNCLYSPDCESVGFDDSAL
jgi:hypothetical protein